MFFGFCFDLHDHSFGVIRFKPTFFSFLTSWGFFLACYDVVVILSANVDLSLRHSPNYSSMLDLMVFCMVQSTQNVNLSETFVSQTVQNLNDGDKIIWDSMLIENCLKALQLTMSKSFVKSAKLIGKVKSSINCSALIYLSKIEKHDLPFLNYGLFFLQQ